MLETELREGITFVLESIEIIQKRFVGITQAADFVENESSITLMDAIAMRLQAIAEKVKRIERHFPEFLSKQGIDPKPVIRFRDFISHHYEAMDYEILFDICHNHLPELQQKLRLVLSSQALIDWPDENSLTQ